MKEREYDYRCANPRIAIWHELAHEEYELDLRNRSIRSDIINAYKL